MTLADVGRVLVVVLHWPTHSIDFSGAIYNVFLYKDEDGGPASGQLHELGAIENKVNGSNILDGVLRGKKQTYPYKTKARITVRLRQLGYLK